MKIKTPILLFCLTAFLFNCQQNASQTDFSFEEKGMIKVTILYPNDEGKTFDMDYYTNQHMPMVAQLLDGFIRNYKIDEGIGGGTPNDPTPYLAIGYLYFDKVSDYESSFGPNANSIIKDIPNYTNVEPVVLISRVLK